MPTNLAVNDRLLHTAWKIGALRTKKDTVTVALKEFIERREQRKILKAMGTIRFRPTWNYKRDRYGRERHR